MAWRSHLSRNLKELRFLFCQTSPASAFTREFVQKNYADLKKLNPKLPILIRECSGVEPQLWARYGSGIKLHEVNRRLDRTCQIDMGVERCVCLDGLTDAQINEKLEELAKAGVAF